MHLQQPLLTPANMSTYLAVINLVAFAAFGIDKLAAVSSARRISEANLLLLAFAGGSPGAYAGRHLFRHKTRKQPFSSELHRVVVLQLATLAAFGAWLRFG